MADRQIMVISVMDRDRPGIVAEVTEGIGTMGGNLADLRESVLCGYFTMILVASFPAGITPLQVEQALAQQTAARVSVEPAEGSLTEATGSEHVYVLSAVGRDRIGLVAMVSRFCFDRGINILDLASHVDGDQYTMMLQLDLSNIQSLEGFKNDMAAFGTDSHLNLVLQHNDIFRATNEI
jgi:glycine cleavage system transcriptional repressor